MKFDPQKPSGDYLPDAVQGQIPEHHGKHRPAQGIQLHGGNCFAVTLRFSLLGLRLQRLWNTQRTPACKQKYTQAQKLSSFLQQGAEVQTTINYFYNPSTGQVEGLFMGNSGSTSIQHGRLIHGSTSIQLAFSFTHTVHYVENTWKAYLMCVKLLVLPTLLKSEIIQFMIFPHLFGQFQ